MGADARSAPAGARGGLVLGRQLHLARPICYARCPVAAGPPSGSKCSALGVITLARCEICGKGTAFGNNVSHSKRATKRTFGGNLQKTVVVRDGRPKRMVVCTRCLKTVHRH